MYSSSGSSSSSGASTYAAIQKSFSNPYTVSDAIITKDGKVIRTNPNDTITASQGGGGTGSSVNISVNISALDSSSISRSLIDNLANELAQRFKREIQGRSSYGVGV